MNDPHNNNSFEQQDPVQPYAEQNPVQNTSQGPTPPPVMGQGFQQGQDVQQEQGFQQGQSVQQGQSFQQGQSVQQPRTHKRTMSSSLKTFLFGFLGALVACVVVLGAYSVINQGSSSVTIGSDGGTNITVQGEDATLAETVAQKALPSVVNIDVYTQDASYMFGGIAQSDSNSYTESSLGSGVILSSDGYILTNYHVIADSDRLMVTANGEEYEAQAVGTDPSSDLAVLKIDAHDLTAIEIGSSSDLVVGEWVMAVGSPFGLEQSVSTGIVSATSRSSAALTSEESNAVYVNMIQTDAAINPGNSGGALVDSNGKLIGINTLIASTSGQSSGVGFAIPIDYAMNIAQQIIDGKTPSHAQLGVSLTTIDSSMAQRYGLPVDSGAYITSVVAGSGAEQAGLQQGDIITKIDDQSISSATDLVIAVREHNPGDTISITYNRQGTETTAEVTLGSDS